MPETDTSMFKLAPAPTIITFDCYGTLVQWYEVPLRGIWVNRRGQTGNPDRLPYAEVSDLNGAAALLLPP